MCIDRGFDLERSLARVDRALELDPGNPAYLDSRGWGLFQLGRVAEAVAPLEQAAAAAENAVILAHLGAVYRALGRAAASEGMIRTARELDPANPEIERAVLSGERSADGTSKGDRQGQTP
jgi:Flp pilus assembly protein TadD